MTEKRFLIVMVLVFGIMILGCEKTQSNSGNNRISKGIQLYNPVGTEYTGNGTVEVVNGILHENPGRSFRESSNLGKIGEVSPDGKLTLELPDVIPENFLFGDDRFFRLGFLEISSDIVFSNGGISLQLMYSDRDYLIEDEDISLKKGWNYFDRENEQILSNTNGFKWIYGGRSR